MVQLGGLLQGSAAALPQNIYSWSQGLVRGLPKDKFSLGTHQLGRVPTWSLYNIHVVADSCTHSTLKTSFPRIPTYHAGYPNGSSISPMGSHPCAWSQSLATKPGHTPRQVEYPHGPSIIPIGLQTLVPTVSLKNEFSQDTHLPYMVSTWPLYNTHGLQPVLGPGNKALLHAPKTPILGPTRTHSPKVSLKNEFTPST